MKLVEKNLAVCGMASFIFRYICMVHGVVKRETNLSLSDVLSRYIYDCESFASIPWNGCNDRSLPELLSSVTFTPATAVPVPNDTRPLITPVAKANPSVDLLIKYFFSSLQFLSHDTWYS